MSVRPTNCLPHLVELGAQLKHLVDEATGTASSKLALELTVGVHEFEDEEGELIAEIGTTRAMVHLNLDGVAIVPGSKAFENVRGPTTVTTSYTSSTGKTLSSELGLEALVLASGQSRELASAKVGRVSAQNHASETGRAQTNEVGNVRALGGNRWEVREADNKILDGTYIRDCDHLCEVVALKGANRASVDITVAIKQRELAVTKRRKWPILGPNRDAILKMLFAKAMHDKNFEYQGVVVLSSAEVDCER